MPVPVVPLTTCTATPKAMSLNAATLDLAQRVGLPAIVDFARRIGIESALRTDLGLALGASEVTLLELSSAYSPFADGGWRSPPRLVAAVVDADVLLGCLPHHLGIVPRPSVAALSCSGTSSWSP